MEGLEHILREHRFFASLDEGFARVFRSFAKNVLDLDELLGV